MLAEVKFHINDVFDKSINQLANKNHITKDSHHYMAISICGEL